MDLLLEDREVGAKLLRVEGWASRHGHRAIVPRHRVMKLSATIAVLIVIATGMYNSWHGLGGTAAPLAHTQWGLVLDMKVFLVCIALALGTWNRRIIHSSERLASVPGSRLLTTLRAEAAMMLLILCISAVLANSPPPQ